MNLIEQLVAAMKIFLINGFIYVQLHHKWLLLIK